MSLIRYQNRSIEAAQVITELKRKNEVIAAFPKEEALLRLSVSILIDINEE